MTDNDMISAEDWDAAIAWDQSEQQQERQRIEIDAQIASGKTEEPGGTYADYNDVEEDAGLFALTTKAADSDCQWVTMRGSPVCIGDSGDIEFGNDEVIDNLESEPVTQPGLLDNIRANPTKDDVAGLIDYAKEVATFSFGKHSLIKRAIQELTMDPTKEDQVNFVKVVGENITLKPVRDAIMQRNKKPNPANDDIDIIVNATVGVFWRMFKKQIKESRETGPAIPKKVTNHRVPMGFKAYSPGSPQMTPEDVMKEVMRRVGNTKDIAAVQTTILDVFEEILQASAK